MAVHVPPEGITAPSAHEPLVALWFTDGAVHDGACATGAGTGDANGGETGGGADATHMNPSMIPDAVEVPVHVRATVLLGTNPGAHDGVHCVPDGMYHPSTHDPVLAEF